MQRYTESNSNSQCIFVKFGLIYLYNSLNIVFNSFQKEKYVSIEYSFVVPKTICLANFRSIVISFFYYKLFSDKVSQRRLKTS